MQCQLLTEGPVRHGGRAADELGVLVDDGEGVGAGEEVEVEDAADDLVGDVGPAVEHVHAVAAEQEHAVRGPRWPHVHVEGVRAVEVDVHVGRADVGVPEREGVVVPQPERALRVLAQPVQRRTARRQRRRHLQVLVPEDEAGGGVEEDVAGGAAGHGEAERGGVDGEHEVRARGGQDAAALEWRRGGGRRVVEDVRRRGARDDVLRHLPSRVVGVGDAHAQPAVRLEAAIGMANEMVSI
uniref:Predicted protein n=1 Tax=Hordeum vulgare subsp. vulgare TaxID=112509 RepID=F2CU76_HORVV|nr:predicted protein [Hordeum vulgare subsp. vulgare]